MNRLVRFACGVALLVPGIALSHHSYAMFDLTRTSTVEGTVAKLEWSNPHTFLWIYVKKSDKPGAFDLWGFENGPPGILQRIGWSQTVLKPGEKVTVYYFPLRDGRAGGHFVRLVRPDGSALNGDKFAPGVGKALEQAGSSPGK
jgi:hypothetical protein